MPTGAVSYAGFDLSIGRMASALAELPRPALAAVRVADPYLQWLVPLALARLGIASSSIPPGTERTVLPAIGADLVIKGGYTQSRLRQMIFGGATSHVLAYSELPVFMAH